jgi:Poly (ADP-ribose) glycohydrolase (PARG)
VALTGLDAQGKPDPARRTSLPLFLSPRHRVDASLPTFYVGLGQVRCASWRRSLRAVALSPTSMSLAHLGRLARGVPVSVSDFARLRGELTGRALPMIALEALVAGEAGLEQTLTHRILPAVLDLARALGDGALEPHEVGRPSSTAIPRRLVGSWLAHVLLGTLRRSSPDFPEVDAGPLLASRHAWEQAKLRCLLGYFERLASSSPAGVLSTERLVLPARSEVAWFDDPAALTALEVSPHGSIEDAAAHRQVDFANQYLGGGVLSGGCVQEEIRFAVAPELLAGMLLSPRMGPSEAIILRGAERYSRSRGYATTLAYGGALTDGCARTLDCSPDVELVAIDAVDYRGLDSAAQYTPQEVLRELTKARCGFRRDERLWPVATGNWGCGAFGGDPQLKAVIQWLAASAEGRGVRYFPFGDLRVGELAQFAVQARAHFATVGALAGRLFAEVRHGGGDLYRRLLSPTSWW